MRIQKKFQGKIPDNKILNMFSESLTDTYSCDFINNLTGAGNITIKEEDPTVPDFIKNLTQEDIDKWNNNTGGVVTETDPVFVASPAYEITQEDIDKWNSGTGGGGITEETDPVFTGSPAYNITAEDINNWNNYTNLGITIDDINNWNNKQEQLVSGVNIKTIDGQSILGSGNISTEYTAGEGISIEGRVISNTITSYNDLKDLPFIPTKITDLIGGENLPVDPDNPDEYVPWARIDKDNNFLTDQTINGDLNANKVKASTQLSVSALGFYKESDGSYTLGKVVE